MKPSHILLSIILFGSLCFSVGAHDFSGIIQVKTELNFEENEVKMVTHSSLPYYKPSDISDEDMRTMTERYFGSNFMIYQRDQPCKLTISEVVPDPTNTENVTLTTGVFQCPHPFSSIQELSLRNTLFAEMGSEVWNSFVTLFLGDTVTNITLSRGNYDFVGSESQPIRIGETISSEEYPPVETAAQQQLSDSKQTPIERGSSWYPVISDFIVLGIEHILTGTDHILFVIALIMIVGNFGEILRLTGIFTIAHSVTLILAGLGLIDLSSSIVEPIIALSIVFMALENFLIFTGKRTITHLHKRLMITFGFGLFHGLGFAGSISDIVIPQSFFLTSLLSFNVGVELGQVLVILCVFPFILWAQKQSHNGGILSLKICSLLIGCIALYWFFERIFL